jgi:hypothetical protein
MAKTLEIDTVSDRRERISLADGKAVLELTGDLPSLIREDERPAFREIMGKIIETLFANASAEIAVRDRFNQAFWKIMQDQSKNVDVDMVQAEVLGLAEREAILKSSGPYLSLEEAGKALGISKQAAHGKLTKGKLLGIMIKDQWKLPAWQFRDSGVVDGLEEILGALNAESALGKLTFFETPNIYLDERTPKEALLKRQSALVLSTAASFGQQGAR